MTTSSITAAEAEPSLLLTSEHWSEQQILKAMQANVTTFMGKLPPDEQREYLRLCNEHIEREQFLSTALNDFYNELNQQLVDALQSTLKSKTGKLIDPRTTYLKTRVRQLPIAHDDLPANDRLSNQVRIFKEDLSVREYERSMTLLEAAHRNFGFTAYFSTEEQRASFISGNALSVKEFVAVVRSVDFGKRIGDYIEKAFKKRLSNALFGLQGTKLVIALRDAYRTREPWSINEWEFNNLKNALFDANIHWDMYQLDAGGDKIAMPFFTRHFDTPDGACVYSYFPDRPDGALRRHASRQEAVDDLQKQIRNDVGLQRFGWFMKAISLNNQEKLRTFIKPLKVNRDELYWHARILYDLFASKTPNREKLSVEKIGPDTRALAHTLPVRQSWPIQEDLIRLARTNQLADREAAVALLTYLVSETLSMLLIPVPGGVTGMSKVMLIAMMGTLAYQTGSAISALRRGQQAELVQAVGDILDLLVGLRLQGVASKLSARRTRKLMDALGNPRYGVAANGKPGLWFVDAERPIDPNFLDGVKQNSQGVFEKNTYSYAKLEIDGKSRIVEVKLDTGSGRYRLTGDASSVLPYITFLPARNHWVLDPVDTRTLSDAQLLQQMVSPSQLSLTPAACQRALDVAGVNRQGLQDIWFGHQPAPVSLIQAIEHQGRYELQTTLKSTDDPTISLLRRRFPDLSHARAADLLQQHPSLREASEYSALAAPVREAIHKGLEQSLITEALSALSAPNDRELTSQSEALFSNLLTLLPGWPDDVGVQVYQGVTDQAGHIVRRGELLDTYGNDDADSFVMLVKSGNRYAGYRPDSGDLQMAPSAENSLLGATLRTLTDAQRADLGREIHDTQGLAKDVLKQAHVHREYLHEFLIPSRELPLSSQSLSAFRIAHKQLPNNADADGIHEMSQRKYVNIDDGTYQVMLDRDASCATRKVWRIVKPDDAVAMDEGNVYNGSRAGESHAITRNAANVWVTAVVGAPGGMRQSGHAWSFHRQLANQLSAAAHRVLSPTRRVRKLFPSFTAEQVSAFIQALGDDVTGQLAQRESEYRTLKKTLKAWAQADVSQPAGWADVLIDEIKRCWRRETGTTFKMPPGSFALPALKADFSHVQELDLVSVNWSEAADAFISNFPNLERLRITRSTLDRLPAAVGELHNLTSLNLSSNKIRLDAKSAETFATLTRLEHVDLSENPLAITPDFSAMTRLKTLDLSNTQIDQWPAGLQSQPALSHLNLRSNEIREIPQTHLKPSAEQLETIARINNVTQLQGNPFPTHYWREFDSYWRRLDKDRPDLMDEAIEGAFDSGNPGVDRYRQLYPSKNTKQARQFLWGLPEGAVPAQLDRLELEYNQLQSQLDAWTFSGGGRRQGYIRAGQLATNAQTRNDRDIARERILSCWRRETPQKLANDGTPIGLELDLSGLRLPSLPDLDADFSHVGSLKLNNMNLSASPEGFLTRYRHLRWLNLANNQLRELPPALGEMHGLTRLFLQNNQIRLNADTARILSERTTLRALWMQGNPQLGLSPDFSQMTGIRSIDLSSTGIDTWPAGLLEQPLLDTVNLDANRITEIPDAVIAPSDARLAQSAQLNDVTSVTGNPLSDDTLEQVMSYAERLVDAGVTVIGRPNRLVVTATSNRRPAAFRNRGDESFRRLTHDLASDQVRARRTQWNTLREQEGAEPFFDLLRRLDQLGTGQADHQRRVWEVIDAITENNAESEALRKEVFERAGEPACCDRAAFSFGNLETIVLVYRARTQALDQSQGAHLSALSRGLFRLHEVDKIAAADIQRSEAIVNDPAIEQAQKLPHRRRLAEEVEIRLAYRYGLKDRLQLPGQPQRTAFTHMAEVTPAMLDAAYESVVALDNSPEEFQALVSREFWQVYVTNKYQTQFEAQRQPFQERIDALRDSFNAHLLSEAAYKEQTDNQQALLAIEEAELVQTLTRQELAE
ncbi:NEL-type E3 ubiquitin ligase domain-containing protein [Pseudomonas orientalis]|uniref:RING-type E3 ubiquitin transferase n=1 Tax=Pseudomonas orientalis TaxID=76758 RepID=A0A8B3Y264_9PSED|nr:NEL-type E3 ubiquitin ligase domain-containing protein [Pseudomonas orientalis]SDU26361.1 Leucine rich repeat-containing protein [Pseudomonas orientalis]